jgi:hypothetical protein
MENINLTIEEIALIIIAWELLKHLIKKSFHKYLNKQ